MFLATTALGEDKIAAAAQRFPWVAGLLIAATALIGLLAQVHWGVNTDTSWNITLAEKVLAGQRPGVDFFEINPPLSYLLYLPAVLAARLAGVRAELMVDLLCFLGAGLSLWLSGEILRRAGLIDRASGARLAVVAAIAVILLPSGAFNEREHIALLASLPCLAALATLASDRRVEPALSSLAGLGAGLAMSIKPHFALFFLPCLVYVAGRNGWRKAAFEIGAYVALAILALYWIAAAIWAPAYFAFVAPIVRDIYIPDRKPLEALLADPSLFIWACLIALLPLIARRRLAEPLLAIPALASVGAMAAYVLQGKLWPYQAYPAIALAALAIGPIAVEKAASPGPSRKIWLRLAAAQAVAGLLLLAGYWLALRIDRTDLEKAIAAIAAHPTILAISPDIETGHPLTRRVHGRWVGGAYGPWITQLSQRALERHPGAKDAQKLEAYMRFDRERLVADILTNKPDVILVANEDWMAWARAHPDVEAALEEYDFTQRVDDTIVYARAKASAR
ncbi:MAG TPA: hypothetical protein VEK35_12110 [Roseiarcus sp.]|nr:hypothetical protein [Roseiarcus sp.]